MVTRRAFLRASAAGVVGLWLVDASGAVVAQAAPGAKGGPGKRTGGAGDVLDARTIRQFALALPIPAAMPRARAGAGVDYEVSVRKISQRMLPPPYAATPLFAYGPAADPSGKQHTFPGPTIEATCGATTSVRWINDLTAAGAPIPHLLPVDPSLHWANPERLPGADGMAMTDCKPALAGRTYVAPKDYHDPATQYTTYAGPVPVVTHLHGAVAVGDESDGYPESWYLPATADRGRYAPYGRWYEFFARKAATNNGTAWAPGQQVSTYPNANRASLLWYHDHALGLTRLNVYAGMAGAYVLRGGTNGDAAITDKATGKAATLPTEIPLIVADRSFKPDGSLYFPDSRAAFDDGYPGPYYPATPVPPVWNPEFFGNTITVNGAVWPRLDVRRGRYRFRMLNACDTRFLEFDFGDIPGLRAWMIGNDGGLLAAPVELTAGGGKDRGHLLLAPAERADVIVDFTGVAAGQYVLPNRAPDAPYGLDNAPPDAATTGRVLAFQVKNGNAKDESTPPERLVLPAVPPVGPEQVVRRVALMEHQHTMADPSAPESTTEPPPEAAPMPVAALLGSVEGDPAKGPAKATARMWMDPVTENPAPGATELWEIYNFTPDAHPVHLHEVTFEVVNRQPADAREGGEVTLGRGPATPPSAVEGGRKDVVIAMPGQVTRVRARFGTAGQYVWHCHILSHEDNEMMRPLRVGPVQPGQPMDMPAGAATH